MLGFVDKKKVLRKQILKTSTSFLLTDMETSVNTWYEVLHFTRGGGG